MKADVLPVALVTTEDIFSKPDLLFFVLSFFGLRKINRQELLSDDLFVLETD